MVLFLQFGLSEVSSLIFSATVDPEHLNGGSVVGDTPTVSGSVRG